MKYKKRYLKELYKDPVQNFEKILDISIYFDSVEELEAGCEAVAALEQIESVKASNLLINDIKNRTQDDFDNYGYQAVWWGLLNENNDDFFKNIANNYTKEVKTLFEYWFYDFLDSDSTTYISIKNFFDKYLN
jgi:hypothetical protein